MKIIVYFRERCHLCEEVIHYIQNIQKNNKCLEVELIDIDSSSELLKEFNDFVPVIKFNGQIMHAPIDYKKLSLILNN